MAYRYGNRRQMQLLPQAIEGYVSRDDPVRAYDAFVEALDLKGLGLRREEGKLGNPEYDPRAMLKLLLYGYSYGIRSSRKLERATYHNLSFIWLMGGLKPDHKTIARFRANHRSALKDVLRQCAQLCLKLGLIEGNTLFVDGSKFRANAGVKNTWTRERAEGRLRHIDERIESLLCECEAIDAQEGANPSLVKLKEELRDREALKARVEGLVRELKERAKEGLNTTDPDCVKVKDRKGIHAGYNSQVVVDARHGLIVHSDVVGESTDVNQFAEQINGANETLGKKCENACADAGYASTGQLKEIHDQGITVIVPSQRQAHNRPPRPFDKEHFSYDSNNDSYTCPEGQTLTFSHYCKEKGHKVYQIKGHSICKACRYWGVCTTASYGRRIRRLKDEQTKSRLEEQYARPSCQAIYAKRKEKVELPFGHIKHNLGVSSFLMRGLEGVRAEMGLLASCFNLARMISLIGVTSLITNLTG